MLSAKTFAPSITAQASGAYWKNRLFVDSGYEELKPTDANGAAVASGVMQGDDFQYSFWFQLDGYKYLVATDGGSSDPWIFTYADAPVGLVALKRVNTWVPKNSEIRVSMYRLDGATTQK